MGVCNSSYEGVALCGTTHDGSNTSSLILCGGGEDLRQGSFEDAFNSMDDAFGELDSPKTPSPRETPEERALREKVAAIDVHEAAKTGKVDEIKLVLAHDPSRVLTCQDSSGSIPLHLVRLLLLHDDKCISMSHPPRRPL